MMDGFYGQVPWLVFAAVAATLALLALLAYAFGRFAVKPDSDDCVDGRNGKPGQRKGDG